MKKLNTTLAAFALMVMVTIQVNAQSQEAQRQFEPVQIPVEPAKQVNFGQLAQWELQHPPLLTRHYIEQGEDHDADFRPIPREVPAGSTAFTIAANREKALANSPATITSFNGILDNGTLIPPDIRGAVGPTYVLETTNQQFNIYTKTGTLQSTLSITTFFSATGGSGYFDPHCVYDPTNGRFIVVIDGNVSNGDMGMFVAVSQTSDPTGAWYVYSFDGIGNKTDFLDYPLLGYNGNWVVVSGNDFIGGSSPVYAKIYVMNRASLYSGTLGTVSTFTDQNAFCMDPAQTFDNTQTTEYLVQDYNGSSGGNGYMQVSTITGSVSAPVYTSGPTIGINQPWSETSVNAKQLGNTNGLEDGDTRTGNSLYINGSLWFTHTVFLPASSPKNSGIDWWQINPSTMAVQQFGRIYDATGAIFYYYPSIAVNSNGDALLGYCTSSSTAYSSAGYAFHAAADAANTMETGVIYKAGVAGYYKTYGGGRNRWGDFSGAAVDPTDNSFWAFSEWANTSNNWGTAIAHIPASGPAVCNIASGQTTTAVTSNSATFNWTSVSGAASYNIQYRVVGTTTWSTGTSTTTSYNATGLTASSNYEWQIQTVCSSGSSAFSASATFTTTTPCNQATALNTSAITNTSATLGWTASSGATSYNVQYRVVGTTTWSTGNTTTTSFNVSGLVAGTNYEWQVQTVCSGGSSAFTASSTFPTTGVFCGVASGLASASITSTGASLSWTAASGASTYNLQWKPTASSTWTTVSGITTNSYALSGLTACTAYQYQVQTVCSSGNSAYTSAASFTTIGCVVNYCASKGQTTYEYINNVKLGTINNTSGDNGGYGNYTAQVTNLAGGTAVTITLTPGFHGRTYHEYWTVYIDYNHNGTLNDAGEIVAEVNGTGAVSKTFTVPTTALNGQTRMRIQMHYNSYETNPCLTYTHGEVEDYTVNITGNAQGPVEAQPAENLGGAISDLKLYPNPAQNFITLEFNSTVNNPATIRVYNLAGQQMMSVEKGASEGYNTESINTNTFSNGMYIFEIEVNGVTTRQKFLISK